MKTQASVLICVVVLGGPSNKLALAQNYPSKLVRIVVPQAPGSPADVFTRLLAQKLSESIGQPVISDAHPGAGGVLGSEVVARAASDGYTLLLGNNSTHGSIPVLYAKLPYDAIKDFAPITLMVATPYVLSVHPSLPVTTVKQLIAFAKSKPGQLNFASAGNGSTHQLCGELFKSMSDINIVHVPYKGGPPAITALLGGEVSMLFSNFSGIQTHIKSGRVKALGVTTAKRMNLLPDLPTMSEAGLPGFEMLSWFGLLAPAGTPKSIISRLNTETIKALSVTDVRSALAAQGSEVMSGSPERFGDYIRDEIEKVGRIAKVAGIKAE